jgi:phospholipid/cholesterol/gamma-HCH transport system substrate-binding protein
MTKELQIGIFVLVALLSLTYVTYRVTQTDGLEDDNTRMYFTILEDASGVASNTPVRMAGISVGRVGNISLDKDTRKARIELMVSENIKLHEGARVTMGFSGVLGDRYVNLTPGNPSGAVLSPGSEILAGDGSGSPEALLKSAAELLVEVRNVVGSVQEALGKKDDVGRSRLDRVAENITKFTEDLASMTSTNREALNEIVANVREVSFMLKEELDRGYEDGTLAQINQMSRNLNAASEDLRTIVADVNEGKGTVGKLLKEEQTYDQINTALSGVNQFVGAANTLDLEVDLHGEYLPDDGNARAYFDLSLIPSPGKEYILGISALPEDVDTTTTTITQDDGSQETVTREEVSDNDIRFTAQFAHRYADMRFRLGIIESSGGLGVDYKPKSLPFFASVNLFDNDEELGPNFKAWSGVYFWKNFYALGGVDRVFNDSEARSYFFGAGMSFNDQDLKLLISTLNF